jgi:hypothetical protein
MLLNYASLATMVMFHHYNKIDGPSRPRPPARPPCSRAITATLRAAQSQI